MFHAGSSETVNDGNTARRAFGNSDRFSVILQTLSSYRNVDPDKFEKYGLAESYHAAPTCIDGAICLFQYINF